MVHEKKRKLIIFFIGVLIPVLVCVFGNASHAQNNQQILYRIPLSEIAEKLEYEYVYTNMIYDLSSMRCFGDLDAIPTGNNIPMTVYIANGNELLFLPEEKVNTEIVLNEELCGAHYSERDNGYLFYTLTDKATEVGGIPVNSLENGKAGYERFSYIIAVDNSGDDDMLFRYNRYNLKDIIKLGEIEVTFDPEKRIDLPLISSESNEYIDAAVSAIKATLKKNENFGKYKIYLETYGRTPGRYYEDFSRAKISGVVVGEGIQQYFALELKDFSGVIQCMSDSEKNVMHGTVMEDKPEERITGVIELGREVIPVNITKHTPEWEEEPLANEGVPGSNDIAFGEMSINEAVSWIEYSCSYSEWFGMNELGYQYGEVYGFHQKEIILYLDKNDDNVLYFIPKDKVNSIITREDGSKIPIYLNNSGQEELYYISKNMFADIEKQLPISFIQKKIFYNGKGKTLKMIGEKKLNVRELSELSVPKIEEDEYVQSMEKQIKELLKQAGKSGKYKIYIGEYNSFGENRVGLSAAVIGEEEYYFRYMLVKSKEDNIYYWPIGFGLNGSLEECEGDRHYMNRLCIERTIQLNRCETEIDI